MPVISSDFVKPVETPFTMLAISARVVPHIMRDFVSPFFGATETLLSFDLGLDEVGQRQLQLAEPAFRGQDARGDRDLHARREFNRIFSNA